MTKKSFITLVLISILMFSMNVFSFAAAVLPSDIQISSETIIDSELVDTPFSTNPIIIPAHFPYEH